MPPTDPRDAELVEVVTSAVYGMILAVHEGEPQRLLGEMAVLVNAIISHRDAMAERASDEALRRAVAMLNAGEPYR